MLGVCYLAGVWPDSASTKCLVAQNLGRDSLNNSCAIEALFLRMLVMRMAESSAVRALSSDIHRCAREHAFAKELVAWMSSCTCRPLKAGGHSVLIKLLYSFWMVSTENADSCSSKHDGLAVFVQCVRACLNSVFFDTLGSQVMHDTSTTCIWGSSIFHVEACAKTPDASHPH